MCDTPIKDWAEVVRGTKTLWRIRPPALVTVAKPVTKPKHPKRRPKDLLGKAYTQVAITSPRGVYADRKGERLARKPHRGWRRVC
jgi:hypothetical protein